MILLGYLTAGLLYGGYFMFILLLWKDRHEIFNTDWRNNVITREKSDQLTIDAEVERFNRERGIIT